jgi:hypothetical protein
MLQMLRPFAKRSLEQTCGMVGQRQHVVARLADGPQGAAVFGRQRPGELLGEIRTRQ